MIGRNNPIEIDVFTPNNYNYLCYPIYIKFDIIYWF